jgi:hypothetical protein
MNRMMRGKQKEKKRRRVVEMKESYKRPGCHKHTHKVEFFRFFFSQGT